MRSEVKVMGSRSISRGQGHEVKVTDSNLSGVITVRCGKREVRQRWGVFIFKKRGHLFKKRLWGVILVA